MKAGGTLRFILILTTISVVFLTIIGFEMRHINDFQIATHFNLQEFASPDTGEVKIDSRLIAILQLIRYRMGCKVIVTSGYRTLEHNHKVGGYPESLHLQGLAVDVTPVGNLIKLFEIAAEFEEVRGLGIYKTHVHIDIRTTERLFWVCLKGKYRYYATAKKAITEYKRAT